MIVSSNLNGCTLSKPLGTEMWEFFAHNSTLYCPQMTSHHQQTTTAEQVFDILSLSPSFSIFCCPFEYNIASTNCQIMQHLNSSPPSCWFTSHSTFNNFMLKSIVSQNMANPSTFPLPNRVQHLPCLRLLFWEFFFSLTTSSSQLISILLHTHIPNLLLYVAVNVQVFAAYSATFHTRHFTKSILQCPRSRWGEQATIQIPFMLHILQWNKYVGTVCVMNGSYGHRVDNVPAVYSARQNPHLPGLR